ncbi:MAG: hypothetical protein IPK63_17770 [Candidatus Competibacteraceae bacterium]|nr:hypothetical protein [Candidatus Competibacteraceae bacterium]
MSTVQILMSAAEQRLMSAGSPPALTGRWREREAKGAGPIFPSILGLPGLR